MKQKLQQIYNEQVTISNCANGKGFFDSEAAVSDIQRVSFSTHFFTDKSIATCHEGLLQC